MTEIEKKVNLYKSTIGQIDKLIEGTEDQEAINSLMQARRNVIDSLGKDVIEKAREATDLILEVFNTVMGSVFEGLREVADGLAQLFNQEGNH